MDVDTFPRGISKSTPDLYQVGAVDLMDVDTFPKGITCYQTLKTQHFDFMETVWFGWVPLSIA